MTQYLSDEWFESMNQLGASQTLDDVGSLSLREVINGSPLGDVTYCLHIAEGKVSFVRDETPATVTFTQDYATAVALHKGELTIHEAFFAGRIRVAGHLNRLLENSDLLQGLSPIFEPIRAATTY